ncbi:hypothetical protein OG747_43370 [Streptomyces sp. NBC_01384]
MHLHEPAGGGEALPQARRQTLEGAGRIRHVTRSQQYVAALTRFVRASS